VRPICRHSAAPGFDPEKLKAELAKLFGLRTTTLLGFLIDWSVVTALGNLAERNVRFWCDAVISTA
jgi:hypothetical protein